MAPKISVVIPVYNCERYLPECIRTLCGQTLRDMEFIFVCDASPDGSLEILNRAEKEDSRIRVISFEKNRGVSAARNAGIDTAQGEYIGFCDSDDWIEPEMFEKLLSACEENGAQISFCRVFKDRQDSTQNVPLGFEDGTCFDAQAIRKTLIPAMLSKETDSDELPLSGYTPRNLFRRETIGDTRFREDIRYAEDLLFIVQCMLKAGKAAAVDQAYYHYRIYGGSVTKHYCSWFLESSQRSDDALEQLLMVYPECVRRIDIRRRKTLVNAVRNLCMKGTPYCFTERVRQAREIMNSETAVRLFSGIRPARYGLRLGMRMGLMKYRLAAAACWLFSYVFSGT